LPVRRGLVVWAEATIAVTRKSAVMLENNRNRVNLLMIMLIVFGRGFGLKAQT
jgi:hypothetical protein